MKNLKSLMFGLVALVLAFGLVFSVSAFKQISAKKKMYSYWRYNPNTEAGTLNGYNYIKIDDPQEPGCEDENEIPCIIQVDDTIISQPALDTYLNNTFTTEDEVIQIAVHTKAEL